MSAMSSEHPAQPPRYFLDATALRRGAEITLGPELSTRLNRVLRVKRGDLLELVDPSAGQIHQVVVERVQRDTVVCRTASSRPLPAPPRPRIVLHAALIRPQRFDLIVEKATELGVDEIRPIQSERSLIRGEVDSRLERWRRVAVEAAEQSRRDHVPVLRPPISMSELAPATTSLRLIASTAERGRRISAAIGSADHAEVHILVGPEGGWTAAEAQTAQDRGWLPITLGPRPLRTETAAIVAVALIVDCLR